MMKNQSDVDSLDGDQEVLDQMNKYYHIGRSYMHIDNGKEYTVMDNCKIKVPDGNWIEGIVYYESADFAADTLFVRAKENFFQRMVLVE